MSKLTLRVTDDTFAAAAAASLGTPFKEIKHKHNLPRTGYAQACMPSLVYQPVYTKPGIPTCIHQAWYTNLYTPSLVYQRRGRGRQSENTNVPHKLAAAREDVYGGNGGRLESRGVGEHWPRGSSFRNVSVMSMGLRIGNIQRRKFHLALNGDVLFWGRMALSDLAAGD